MSLHVAHAQPAPILDWFGEPVTLRGNGRLMTSIATYRVKTPDESEGPFDLYVPIGQPTPEQAFLPVNPACL